MDILILIGSFFLLCLLGMPVAYALGLSAILAALWIDIPLEAVMLKTSDGMDDFALLAIPFFILAGGIMAEGGMAARLVNLAKIFVGWIRGGLALVNILASAFFGCISGSSVADTASIGSVMIPQMIKNGYPRLFAVNVTVSGSLQPLLIPPSHNAVIYSLAGGTISISDLFLGGAVPGLLLGLSDDPGPDDRAPGELPEGRSHPIQAGGQDCRRGVLPASPSSSFSAESSAACSPRPNPRRSPASIRSSLRCSSIATIAGASCRFSSDGSCAPSAWS